MYKPDKGLFVAIDPGLKGCGVAIFRDGTLTWCGCARFRKSSGPRQWVSMAEEVVNVVEREAGTTTIFSLAIERMETRRKGKKSGSSKIHDDLFQLTHVAGAIFALLDWERAFSVRPSNWTKSPKHVNYEKAKTILDNEGAGEYDVLVEGVNSTIKKHMYEVSDAACIGLFCLRRFK